MQTEYEFTLPRGFMGPDNQLHRDGAMRLATAHDEIAPLRDPRVRANPGYLVVILLSRVVTRLGELTEINPGIIEGLFASDLAYLEARYRELNDAGADRISVICPDCERQFDVELAAVGR